MDAKSQARVAAAQHSAKAAERRRTQLFTLSFRGGGASEIIGYSALAAALGVKQSSIPVLLSRGTGNSFDLMRPNPLTGEPDICTVVRVVAAKEKKQRGRPRKAPDLERLGSEAPK